MRLGTTFSGIGACEQALTDLGVKYKSKWACEIDKFARETYLANHEAPKEYYWDIRDINISYLDYVDFYCFGFPCTDLSIAGAQDLKRGRSALVSYSLDIIDKVQPKYILFENVKALTSKKFADFFQFILDHLGKNYNLDYETLNSKNFGVPHYRERIFCLGIRKDLKKKPSIKTQNKNYSILGDILEVGVDEKYFLSEQCIKRIENIKKRAKEKGLGYSDCILNENDKFKNLDASYYKGPDGKRGIINNNGRLRMVTPREAARLQGFPDDFIIPVSNTQAYKQFGNTITVPILKHIIERNIL